MKKGLASASPDYSSLKGKRVAILSTQWNWAVTEPLLLGAKAVLQEAGLPSESVEEHIVPGAYELPTASKWLAERIDIDAVVALGCIIQGETRHFEFISQAVAQGLSQVGVISGKPVIFGVLTTDTIEQALARAGGEHGHKGREAADAALQMLLLKEQIRNRRPSTPIGFSR
jgi:6,7-dimethyl-8-ribityllumazine synthase